MSRFKDAKDREWELRLDAPLITRIREDCDPEFMVPVNGEDRTYFRLQDPVLLCGVIYALCRDECERREISQESFYANLTGDVIDAATEGLLKAILSFTPRRQREMLEATAARMDRLQQIATSQAVAALNNPEFDQRMEADLRSRIDAVVASFGIPSSNAAGTPASSASPPAA